jgi:signal transduction histidine kinase
MFTRIRNRLTFLYTAFTGIALSVFVAAFYFGLSAVLLREQEQEALGLAAQQAQVHHEQLEDYDSHSGEEEEERHRPAVSAAGDYYYYVLSANGRIVGINDPLPELRSEILARVSTWQTRKTEVAGFTLADGRQVTLMLAGVPAYNDNRAVGMVFVGKDLSAHYHFLDRLLQALVLSFLVFLCLAGLAGHYAAGKALIPIQDAFAVQRKFLADASHELRTPLSVFQASLEVLEKKEGANLASFSRQLIDDLKDEVRRMTLLVSNLLTLARSDAGVLEIWKDHVDLRPIAEHAIRSLEYLAAKKNITLSLSAPDRVMVYADKDRISQLLFLLIDNGIKYTPSGGYVSVYIYPSKNQTSLGISIEVRDTGIGMTSEERAQIFARFYRADKSRSRETGGFGLGLSIAAWIVSMHGGTISVTSEPGAGSTFTVFIPSS